MVRRDRGTRWHPWRNHKRSGPWEEGEHYRSHQSGAGCSDPASTGCMPIERKVPVEDFLIEVGQQPDECPHILIVHAGRKENVGVIVIVGAERYLAQIVLAGISLAAGASPLNGGEQQADAESTD